VCLNDVERAAFNKLKQALISAVGVYTPDYSKRFIISCDASDRAVAGCLSQIDSTGVERPIAFISAKLNPTQSKWSTIEKESYACLYALKSFDMYVYGAEIDLITDNNPLVYLAKCSPRSPKLERWILGLQRWNLSIQHRAGKLNVVPDCLSRY
jgi:hypothetical protein